MAGLGFSVRKIIQIYEIADVNDDCYWTDKCLGYAPFVWVKTGDNSRISEVSRSAIKNKPFVWVFLCLILVKIGVKVENGLVK